MLKTFRLTWPRALTSCRRDDGAERIKTNLLRVNANNPQTSKYFSTSKCARRQTDYPATFSRSMSEADTIGDTFLYFAYGSNLSTARIHVQNPSAVRKHIAKLQDYSLQFDYRSQRWGGAPATIEQQTGDHVWGVVWELNKEHLATLDDQEGVHYGVYRPLEIVAETPSGEQITCRTYQLCIHDSVDKLPSTVYKRTILTGARENGLPPDYIDKLHAIRDNGYDGEVDIMHPDEPLE